MPKSWHLALLAALLAANVLASSEATDCVTRQEFAELTTKLLSQVALLEAKVQSLTLQQQEGGSGVAARNLATVEALGEAGIEEGRRLSAAVCCRWTSGDDCGSSMTRGCTALHEYLEAKTTMHEFENVETCLGGTDHSKYTVSYDGVSSNVSLKYDSTVVTTTTTPLKVTHATACATTAPTLTLQMSTDVPKIRVPMYSYANGHGMTIGGVTATHRSSDTAFGTPMPPKYVTVDLGLRLAFLMMVNSGRLLVVRHAETGMYLKCDSGNPRLKIQDRVGGHEKVRIATTQGQLAIVCHNDDFNRNLQMTENDNYELQADDSLPGVWERFQVWIPDSGGVANGACNHPGAFHMYNNKHGKYIECNYNGGSGDCIRGDFDTDTKKCNSAWYFHYALIE
jgi:hypothetical protein